MFWKGAVKRFPAAEQTALSRPEVKQHCALMDSVCPDRQLPTSGRLLPHWNAQTTRSKLLTRDVQCKSGRQQQMLSYLVSGGVANS